MRKIATKLTPKVKEFIKKEFKTNNYNNEYEQNIFHFPNYKNGNGFLIGKHSSNELKSGYTEASEDEFINSFNKPKRGDLVLVSSNNEDWNERIFLTELKGSETPIIAVSESSENSFKEGLSFNHFSWKYMKPIETITKEEAEKILNKKIV